MKGKFALFGVLLFTQILNNKLATITEDVSFIFDCLQITTIYSNNQSISVSAILFTNLNLSIPIPLQMANTQIVDTDTIGTTLAIIH